ncbi:DNA-binding protein RFX2-like [Rhopalosiphum maidis]|uniref:DNA-binding protein RFX2-like n=1 Tax=Rhopalosiphum maidis TaxID=43146 RepID=UPI000EFDC08E|nr:DNA-binding protein RFX2-like [Rhopalosiphum maidis]
MAISVKSRIKLEESAGTSSQINAITVLKTGEVGQTHIVQPVQQTSVNINSNRQLANALPYGINPVHKNVPNKLMDDDKHRLDHKNRNSSTVAVNNDHYVVTALVPKIEPIDSYDIDSTYVQYVEETDKQTIFKNEQNMTYPIYTVNESGTMYQAGQTHYAPSTNSYSQIINTLGQPTCHAQIISNGTYIVQQNVDNYHTIISTSQRDSPNSTISSDMSYHTVSTIDSDITNTNINQLNDIKLNTVMQNSSLMRTNKISPVIINWLMENYEMAEGVSLLRSTIYNHYLTHCSKTKIDPVIGPSFGKIIRSVFTGLRTRRLGTRGNSKYHYYGIRIKASSLLNDFKEEENLSNQTNQNSSSKNIKLINMEEENCNQYTNNNSDSTNCSQNFIPSSPQAQDQEYLGDGTNVVPEFPDIILNELELDDNCTLDDVDTFKNLYREHYEAFLGAILNLEFNTVESLWRQFWCSQDNNNDKCEEKKCLSKKKLYALSKCKTLQLFVKTADFLFYQNLVKVLIPDVLRTVPRTLTQAIRHFSKGVESWLISAMQGCPEEMISIKVTGVRTFAQTLRRYTTARAVLQNYTQINQMLTDLNHVDFRNIQEQVQLISTLGSENDSVYTKKRVYSKINECSEMISDFNELSKKTKTHNYSATTSTDTECFNVLVKNPSKETNNKISKMEIKEEIQSKDEFEQKHNLKIEYLKEDIFEDYTQEIYNDTAMINSSYNPSISEVHEEYSKLSHKLSTKQKNEQKIIIKAEIMSPTYSNKRKRQTTDKEYSKNDFPRSEDSGEEACGYDSNNRFGDYNEDNFEFFAAQDDYKSEYPTMDDTGLFSCQYCDKEFSNANSLSRHENVHTGKTPIECDVCFKTFISKSILCIHKRSHTGEKPYACNVCGRSFTQKSHLVLHHRTHTGEKPYKCGLCEKKFSSTSGRAEHTRRRHPYV